MIDRDTSKCRPWRRGIRTQRAASSFLATCVIVAGTAGAVLAAPATSQAQEPDEGDSECVCLDRMIRPSVRAFRGPFSRARLGVVLGEETRVDGRSGIALRDVAEGTPAWRAGLRSGDVVVALDDRELGEDAGTDVLEFMADVEPGDTVVVRYLRDADEGTASVVTEEGGSFGIRSGKFDFSGAPTSFELRRTPGDGAMSWVMPSRSQTHLRRVGALYRHSPADELELTPMNQDLGEYFGTSRGVLVTKVARGSTLGLTAGDVILAIGGRDVRDPAHAHSIIASYRPDEEIPFRVVREHGTMEVSGKRSDS